MGDQEEKRLRWYRDSLVEKKKEAQEDWNKFCAWLDTAPSNCFTSEDSFRRFKTEETDYYNETIGYLDDELFRVCSALGEDL